MISILLLTLFSVYVADASSSNQVGPVKPDNPNAFVAQVFTNMLKHGVTLATELNDKAPKGDINKPYEQIATLGYLKYVEAHPEMIDDAKPFIESVNDDENAQYAWRIVGLSKGKSLAAREKALNFYYTVANVPLAKEEKKVIPKLELAPFMVGIMLANQNLTLNDEQKKVWNAIFASTASILQAMETQDKEAFSALFKNDLPSSCNIQ